MSSTTSVAPGPRGRPMLTRRWPRPPGPRRGRIVIVHGIAEHSGRYERTGDRLAAAGFDVEAIDLPGFGGSGGRRAYVDRWSDYFEPVAVVLGQSRAGDDGLDGHEPTVLLGHSMGALICLTYVLENATSATLPDLLVLSAPPIVGNVPRTRLLAAGVLSRIAPRLEVRNGLDGAQLSRDDAVATAYFADPLVHPRTTTRLGAELFAAMGRARTALAGGAGPPVPTLVLHGSDDSISLVEGSALLEGKPGVERRVLRGLRHEIFNEPEGPEVVDMVIAWIEAQRVTAIG